MKLWVDCFENCRGSCRNSSVLLAVRSVEMRVQSCRGGQSSPWCYSHGHIACVPHSQEIHKLAFFLSGPKPSSQGPLKSAFHSPRPPIFFFPSSVFCLSLSQPCDSWNKTLAPAYKCDHPMSPDSAWHFQVHTCRRCTSCSAPLSFTWSIVNYLGWGLHSESVFLFLLSFWIMRLKTQVHVFYYAGQGLVMVVNDVSPCIFFSVIDF